MLFNYGLYMYKIFYINLRIYFQLLMFFPLAVLIILFILSFHIRIFIS